MLALTRARLRSNGHRHLAVNGAALIANAYISGLLGFVFWIVAARAASPQVVGRAAAITATVIGIVSFCQQSLVVTVPTLIATSPDPRRVTRTAYLAALGLTAVAALGYVAVAPLLFSGLRFLHEDLVLAGAVALFCMTWSTFSLQDAVLTGARRGTIVLVENTTWGVARILLLIPIGALGVVTLREVLLAWIAPAALLVVAVTFYLFIWQGSPIAKPLGDTALTRRQMLSFVGPEHAAGLAMALGTLLLPAVALTKLDSGDAAAFMAAYSALAVFEMALGAFSFALAVELTKAAVGRARLFGFASVLLGAIVGITVVAAWVESDQLMSMFGRAYTSAGGDALRLLALGLPARAVWFLGNALNRSRQQGWVNAYVQFVYTGLFVVLVMAGAAATVPSLALTLVACRCAAAVTVVGAELLTRRGRRTALAPAAL